MSRQTPFRGDTQSRHNVCCNYGPYEFSAETCVRFFIIFTCINTDPPHVVIMSTVRKGCSRNLDYTNVCIHHSTVYLYTYVCVCMCVEMAAKYALRCSIAVLLKMHKFTHIISFVASCVPYVCNLSRGLSF